MAAGEGEKAEEKSVMATKKGQIGVDAAYEEKGARVVEKGKMGVKAIDEGKGVTAEGKTTEMVAKKEEEDSTLVVTEEGEIVEGKGKGKGKRRESDMVEKNRTMDWELEGKRKVMTAADGEEGSKARRDQGATVNTVEKEKKKEKNTTAGTEWGGENTIAATWKMITQVRSAATATATAEKMVTLVSSEGLPLRMSEAAARQSVVLTDMIDNGCAGGNIPLPNIDDRALAMVIKYCNKHAAAEPSSNHGATDEGAGSSSANTATSKNKKALDEWDNKLVCNLTQDALFDLITAADFLDIKGLLDACCQKVADMITKKTTTQIRDIFGIDNDFTAEEEEALRNESPWVFDDKEA